MMHNDELVALMGDLARLTSPRSSTPAVSRWRLAYQRIEEYARAHGEDEEWCDLVMCQLAERGPRFGLATRAA